MACAHLHPMAVQQITNGEPSQPYGKCNVLQSTSRTNLCKKYRKARLAIVLVKVTMEVMLQLVYI